MASAFAVQDKLMLTEKMAEKMRFLAMLRATLAYHKGLVQSGRSEERLRLLLKGIASTLEQAERALETVGLVSHVCAPNLPCGVVRQHLIQQALMLSSGRCACDQVHHRTNNVLGVRVHVNSMFGWV